MNKKNAKFMKKVVEPNPFEFKSAIELIQNYIEAIPEQTRYLPNQTILISKKTHNEYCKEYFANFPFPIENTERTLKSPIDYPNFRFIIF